MTEELELELGFRNDRRIDTIYILGICFHSQASVVQGQTRDNGDNLVAVFGKVYLESLCLFACLTLAIRAQFFKARLS